MFSNSKGSDSLQVTIDDQPVDLPDWLSDTLPAIQTYLECMAMKKERVLWALEVDGVRVDLADTAEQQLGSFRRIQAQTIGFAELRGHLLKAGRSKLTELLDHIEEGCLLVLINDWKVAWRLWRDWEPQVREPLFSLRALQELNETAGGKTTEDGQITKLVEELGFIVCEVEHLFAATEQDQDTTDPVLFSELLEYTLVPWLKKLDAQFSRFCPGEGLE
jgi:hypothetical protein